VKLWLAVPFLAIYLVLAYGAFILQIKEGHLIFIVTFAAINVVDWSFVAWICLTFISHWRLWPRKSAVGEDE